MSEDVTGGQRREPPMDARALYEAIERSVLGSPGFLTRAQVAEMAGVPLERAAAIWRSLGFTRVSDEETLFVDADVEALRLLAWLVEEGFVDAEVENTIARSMGRSFARLAEWEVAELTNARTDFATFPDTDAVEAVAASLVPVMEDLQNYVWRRHLASAAGRLMLRPRSGEEGVAMAVGFADIVGFTRRSRRMSTSELARLVDVFEEVVSGVITEHHGRVIKTIGDEVLFVADDPVQGGRIALALADGHRADESFPEVRVGAAYGEVLNRLGDVFGEVVNVAARLTSLARPGRVLLDRELAHRLRPRNEEFRVRRGRNVSVRGYSRLETWGLRPARAEMELNPLETLGTLSDLASRIPRPPTPWELRDTFRAD